MLSHELRNPLAPIRNAVEVIRRIAPPDAKLTLGAPTSSIARCAHLTRLVDDLLDVSRITQGKIVAADRSRSTCARGGRAQRRDRAAAHRRASATMLIAALPRGAGLGARRLARLAQVVGNLLNNAAKYTAGRRPHRAVG